MSRVFGPFNSLRIARSCAAGALVGFLIGGLACGEDDADSDSWNVGEPGAEERFDSLQTGIYRATLQIDVDECSPSIAELDAAYEDWPARLIPVNVSPSEADGQSTPSKDLQLLIPSPRHGEMIELVQGRISPSDLTDADPLFFEPVTFGGCENDVQNGVAVSIEQPGTLDINYYVDYQFAPGCSFGRWSPQLRCVEDFTFELEPIELCDAGCVAVGEFEPTSWEGFSPTYPSAVEATFGCECE
ncbi:hypothetical protein [Persicimonas caeni]|nr:hypothetical protein [Persicimonas caeni]